MAASALPAATAAGFAGGSVRGPAGRQAAVSRQADTLHPLRTGGRSRPVLRRTGRPGGFGAPLAGTC